jgi:hypothetical protein
MSHSRSQKRVDPAPVRKGGPYTFEDIHKALFPTPPEPKTLEELKQGIEDYIRDKHAGR